MDIVEYLSAYIPLACFLLAAVGTILLAPKPLLERHIWGIELTITGILGFSAWIGWNISHDWFNLFFALLVIIVTDSIAYQYLTKRKS